MLLDADKSSPVRQMVGVKAAALRVLRLVADDEERIVELGCYRGFQVCVDELRGGSLYLTACAGLALRVSILIVRLSVHC